MDSLLLNGGIRMENNKKLGGLDYFKLIAAFLVIAIHTSPLSSLNSDADFVFTRVLARMAVPFFFMVTGFFLLPRYVFEHSKDYRPILRTLKKTLVLYGVAIFMYLPVNLYAGQFSGSNVWDFARLILFDGTFYHLWYLPASLLGVVLIVILCRKLSFRAIACIAAALYGFGLLGDSYFGLAENIPVLNGLYERIFEISSYTRNGFFYAPIFLLMGAAIRTIRSPGKNTFLIAGFLLSVICMAAEGFTLHHLDLQRHDSMYLALPFCMYFLYQLVLRVHGAPARQLRRISTGIYLIHPIMIILIRGTAKLIHAEELFIENSLVHYIAVCLASFLFAWLIQKVNFKTVRRPFPTDRAWIEISKENLQHNAAVLQHLLPSGCQLMPAVKANAYGHGAVLVSKELQQMGITSFCVATVTEGIELRRNGIKGEILILGYTHPEQFYLLRRYKLTQTVIDYEYGKQLNGYGKKIKVHIKIDTGMHRLGERADRIEEICDIFKLENLMIRGAFTHLCGDESRKEPDFSFTQSQAAAFYQVIDELKNRGHDCGKVHLLASYGLINYPELAGDYARIGIALYGVLSNRSDSAECPVNLKPVLSIKTRIAQIKDLYTGESAGYGLQYVADSDRKIAVLPIGYADGIPRALSCCHGNVLINGKAAPIIGRICMDQMMVDVTGIPNVTTDSIAVIIGRSEDLEITAYDLADESSTITNEVLSRLGNRLTRIIV